MNILWFILILVTILALAIKPQKEFVTFPNESKKSVSNSNYKKLIVFIVFIILAVFAGLRSSHNDTLTYLYNFSHKIPENFSKIDWTLGNNPGFHIYQVLIKLFISSNKYVFLLVTSLITLYFFTFAYYKYSPLFYLTIFLFFSSGLVVFSMAAIKQAMAMSLGFWAFQFAIKKKWKTYILVILVAATIHPFILLYLIIPFLGSNIWSKRIILLFLLAVSIGIIFERFVGFTLEIAGSIGTNYELEYITKQQGMNFFRVAFFSITPILSFIFRDKINFEHNTILVTSINMAIVSFLFMIIASFGGANMFGSLGNYFEPFNYIALPWILTRHISQKYRSIAIGAVILVFCLFFYYQFAIAKQFTYTPWI